jgi:dTDP-4-amino-4,6-dideoxygalactose transaminase
MQVKFFDLKQQNDEVRDEVLADIKDLIEKNQFVYGPKTLNIEQEIADYCGAKYGVAVASGTDALLVALMALDLKPGDEVITTPFTFFATVGSIVRAGATPVFADIDPDTFNIDPAEIKKKITGNTKCIMPVHLYGQCADMSRINELAKSRGIVVIEDAAQAIGARQNDKYAGNLSDIGCFSFYPTKNLGGFGDSGMVTTNDEKLYNKIVSLRNHGELKRYYHDYVGGNFRMDNFQAVALSAKLKRLDGYIEKRRRNAALYKEFFGSTDVVTLPKESDSFFHTFNQFVITTESRDELKDFLQNNGIGSAIYYPLCLHEQECFNYLGYATGDFPVSEETAKRCLALPIYPELTDDEIKCVAEKVKGFFPS